MPEQRGDVSDLLSRGVGQRAKGSIEAIRKSGGRLGEVGIPEMIDYLRRIGYKVGRGRGSCCVERLRRHEWYGQC